MLSRISMYTYSTGEGITPGGTVDDATAEATEEVVGDSEINENIDIIEMEKRDFDDVEGI
jgi:protein involved in sex pheromone biosynthesis